MLCLQIENTTTQPLKIGTPVSGDHGVKTVYEMP